MGLVHVAAITGLSESGKTTLVTGLIRLYRERGLAVAAIKHTHHALNEVDYGDTRRFREAGADPVLFVSGHEAVVRTGDRVSRVAWSEPEDLLEMCSNADVVLVEGFRDQHAWPRIAITAAARPTLAELAAELDRIWRLP